MKKIDTDIRLSVVILICIFLIMLACNFFTLYCVDDYGYMYSFETDELLTGFKDIPASMKAHGELINGRLFAHGLVQAFLVLPKAVFNVINAGMFTFCIWLIYDICRNEKKSNILLVAIFCMIWIFTPVFGQVFLWLDGSVNYLWGAVFSLCIVKAYYDALLKKKYFSGIIQKILFVIFSFFVGGYLENISVATIFLSGSFLLLIKFYNKDKLKAEYVASLFALIAGMLFMISRPAEYLKSARSVDRLYLNLIYIIEKGKMLFVPILIFMSLMIIELSAKKTSNKGKILVAAIFFMGAMSANCVMLITLVYPDRCALIVAIYLIVSCGILYETVDDFTFHTLLNCSISALILMTIYTGFYSVKDIVRTYELMKVNNEIIMESSGKDVEVVVPVIHPKTKYSALYGLEYYNTERKEKWPYEYPARYYNVRLIVGVDDEEAEAQIMHEKLFGY